MYLKLKCISQIIGGWILLSIPIIGLSQAGNKIDSLLIELNKEKVDSTSIDLWNQIGIESSVFSTQAALEYFNKSYQRSLIIGDSSRLVRSGRLRSVMLRKLDRLSEAIEQLTYVFPIATRRNLRSEYKAILNEIALDYTYKAEYDKALEYHFKSLVEREADGLKNELSITLNNIGLVYYKLRNYQVAIDYYTRSLQLKRESSDIFDLDYLLINIGLSHNEIGDYSEAQVYIKQGLIACGGQCEDDLAMQANYGLGVSFFYLALEGSKDYNDAEEYFNKSLVISRSTSNKRFQAENLIYLARIAVDRKETDKAIKALMETEELSKASGYNEILIDAYRWFSELYVDGEDFKNASEYQDKYITLKDSTYSEELISNLATIQTQYEERENIKTIAVQNELVALQEALIDRQEQQYVFIIVITFLILGLAAALYSFNRRQRKTNQDLAAAKRTIEEQNLILQDNNQWLDRQVKVRTHELFESNEALTKVNDELDHFIYKTSHDIRGPLATLKGMANLAIMDVKDPVALDYLKKLDTTAGKLNSILTRLLIINQINHSVLVPDFIDFHSIIYDILLQESKKGIPPRIKIDFDVDQGVSLRSDRDLIRIILDNLIDNAIKYYNESLRVQPFVNIKIVRTNTFVIIRVVDNGIGISETDREKIFHMFTRVSERSDSGGIGLYLTKLATEKLAGEIKLRTTEDKCTEFSVILPLDIVSILEQKNEDKLREEMDVDNSDKQKNLKAS